MISKVRTGASVRTSAALGGLVVPRRSAGATPGQVELVMSVIGRATHVSSELVEGSPSTNTSIESRTASIGRAPKTGVVRTRTDARPIRQAKAKLRQAR